MKQDMVMYMTTFRGATRAKNATQYPIEYEIYLKLTLVYHGNHAKPMFHVYLSQV